jgi:hypothetical protein
MVWMDTTYVAYQHHIATIYESVSDLSINQKTNAEIERPHCRNKKLKYD